jgi:hypothetical protein
VKGEHFRKEFVDSKKGFVPHSFLRRFCTGESLSKRSQLAHYSLSVRSAFNSIIINLEFNLCKVIVHHSFRTWLQRPLLAIILSHRTTQSRVDRLKIKILRNESVEAAYFRFSGLVLFVSSPHLSLHYGEHIFSTNFQLSSSSSRTTLD